MKASVLFVGLIVVLLGLLPLLIEQGFLPVFLSFLPEANIFYQICSIVLGGILIYFGFKRGQ